MKKLVALFTSLIMALSFASAVGAAPAAPPLEIYVNDKLITFKEDKPVKENGTTLVPVRMLLEQLDFELEWHQESQVATATSVNPRHQLVISLQIGNDTAYVNGKPQKLLLAPKKINQRTYVPLRFIVEQSGYQIDWNEQLNRISIDTILESKGFMWKAEKNGNVVYLLGSIHVASEAMYPLRDELNEAFDTADYLAVEVNTSVEKPGLGDYIEDLATYKDGTTLRNHVSAELYEALVELLEEIGAPANALDHLEPWYVSMIVDSLSAEDSEFEAELGIDLHFMNKAKKANIPIMELESYESQLQMFNDFSDRLQEQFLYGSLYKYYQEEDSVEDLSEMWITGDVDALTDMADEVQADEEYYNAVLRDRNLLMAQKINGFLTGSNPATFFVVVGALHMVGEHGLVTLLEEMGYTVTQV
ncbi:TraB/GumN family protein [Paenibacillus sp. PL2-23]|uniref:TraB/GumN family protein n=1 Tax=Paenibacillus sp. PL2-23 TaxID=2100729 RepID=UPI0030F92E78